MGQHTDGRFDRKGCVIDLEQQNTNVTIPFCVSSRGYGLLWNNPSQGRAEFGPTRTRWTSDCARQIDYVVMAGATSADILARYADCTGHAPMLPAGSMAATSTTPEFRELIVRWFQFGCFCPIMRLHGVRAPAPACWRTCAFLAKGDSASGGNIQH